jgi:hypothetical protein
MQTSQGSKITKRGVETLILFDPMTHTPEGYVHISLLSNRCKLTKQQWISDSGIGDHGEEGVARFVAEHRCTYICHGLGFDSLSKAGAYTHPGAGDESDGDD